jgi:hypothetical protein
MGCAAGSSLLSSPHIIDLFHGLIAHSYTTKERKFTSLLEFPYRHPCTRTELSICSVYLAAVFILEESSCDESFRATGGSHIGSTCALPRDILTLYYPNPMSTNQSTFSKKQSHKWVLINFISDRNTIQYNITDKTNIQKPNSEQQ